jgi:hypothetical protein
VRREEENIERYRFANLRIQRIHTFPFIHLLLSLLLLLASLLFKLDLRLFFFLLSLPG